MKKPRKISWYTLLHSGEFPELIISFSISCAVLKVRCDGRPGNSCTRCQKSKLACTYRDLRKSPLPSRDLSTPGTSSISPTATDVSATSNFRGPVDDAASRLDYGITPPTLDINSAGQISAAYKAVDDSFAPYSPLPVSCRQTSKLFRYDANSLLTDGFSALPLESLYGFVMDSSDSYLGWGMDSSELDHMNTLNTHAPNSPPANWFPADSFDSGGLIIQEPEYSREPISATPVPTHSSARDAQPADSPWVGYLL